MNGDDKEFKNFILLLRRDIDKFRMEFAEIRSKIDKIEKNISKIKESKI